MADHTQVDVETVRSGAAALQQASDRIQTIGNTLRSALEAEGQAWGADKPGTTHGIGYDKQTQENMDAVENRFDTTASYAENIQTAADNFVSQEDANTQSF
ncbi:hypothetical protein [Williamsia sp.]|uniref:hypothetical protein n=1 Tax=Williamsia sp. TaxID=1872085 RepID=UPI001A1F4447|nr:hypothetical protein [Williamsia sp.]MBJ7291232.1 hypothetical protein [Williamsia sp.]